VRRAREDYIDIVAPHGFAPVRERFRTIQGGKLCGAARIDIAAYRHCTGGKGGGTLSADQPATDDGRAQ